MTETETMEATTPTNEEGYTAPILDSYTNKIRELLSGSRLTVTTVPPTAIMLCNCSYKDWNSQCVKSKNLKVKCCGN